MLARQRKPKFEVYSKIASEIFSDQFLVDFMCLKGPLTNSR